MTSRDNLIIGGNLAAQLTAVLLARLGQKVTHLDTGTPGGPFWNNCPPLLLRLLDSLEARTCLCPARPLQIITEEHQVELHGGLPLQDELRREFPHRHRELLDFLNGLQHLAERLTDYLWDGEGLATGWLGHLGTPWMRMRHGLLGRGLNRPLAGMLTDFPASEQIWLKTLLAGYARCDWRTLSLAEAALIWAELSSAQELSRAALREQLKNRLVEHAGEWRQIDPSALKWDAGNPRQVTVGQQTYQATALLSETDPESVSERNESLLNEERFRFADGHPAGHLADRLLVAGRDQTPLRIALQMRDGTLAGALQSAAAATETASTLDRLKSIFPFCRLESETAVHGRLIEPRRRAFLGLRDRLDRGPGNWDLNTGHLLPALGNTADCLLAMSLVSRLAG